VTRTRSLEHRIGGSIASARRNIVPIMQPIGIRSVVRCYDGRMPGLGANAPGSLGGRPTRRVKESKSRKNFFENPEGGK